MQQFYDRYRWAEDLFPHRDYRAAARVLEELLGQAAERPDQVGHGLGEARAAFRMAEALGAPA
jgi:hypothetical protein